MPVLAAPTITPSATSGPPGTVITVSGRGFAISESYQIIFSYGNTTYQQTVDSAHATSATGTFDTPVTIPQVPYGQYIIRASTASGNAELNFGVIASITMSSTSGNVGDTLLVSGAAFRSAVPVFVYFNNVNIISTSTDTNGTMTPVSFRIPKIRAGNYYVYATDGDVSSSPLTFTMKTLLSPNTTQGGVGDTVQLQGTGFEYNSGVTILWDNATIDTAQTVFSDNNGSFLVSITVPTTTRGTHTIKARDNSLYFATTSFSVISSLTLEPSSASHGITVSMVGKGFQTTHSVEVTFNGTGIVTQPTTINTNTNGSFLASFVVPEIVVGSYTVRAFDGTYVATAICTVSSMINLNPSTGNVGTEVAVTGTGFSPDGTITLSYDNQTLKTVTAASDGSFSTNFNAPASSGSTHTVSGREGSSGVPATATFAMESTPPPAPDLVAPADDSQTDVQPTFKWSGVTDPSSVTYDLQIARDNNLSQVVLSKMGLSQVSYQLSQSEALDLIKQANPYYWHIRAVDGASNASDWTATRSFYTKDSTPPLVPILQNPASGARAGATVSFDWSDTADPSGVSYLLQVADDVNFSHLLISKSGLSQSRYRLTSAERLPDSTGNPPSSYYWRVRAIDGAENQSDWSNPNSFYVGGFFQGMVLYALAIVIGLLLLVIGIFVGTKLRPQAKPKA